VDDLVVFLELNFVNLIFILILTG